MTIVDQEIIVSIPETPTDIAAFATSAPAFTTEPTGNITVYSEDGVYLASDTFDLYIRVPACADVVLISSHDLTRMEIALDATTPVTQLLASYTDEFRVLEMGYCTPYYEISLSGTEVPFLTLS